MATTAAGRGRSGPSESAQLITAPCEKPPRTMRSSGTGSASRKAREQRHRRVERRRVGRRDPGQRVPVTAARRQPERAARRDAEEPPVGVEQVEEREEVVLVRPAAVEKDERSLWLACGLAPASDELGHARGARGSGSGVSVCSTWARRCSNAGGRISASPRCSGSSSMPNPGPSVASSKRTPLGSRK